MVNQLVQRKRVDLADVVLSKACTDMFEQIA